MKNTYTIHIEPVAAPRMTRRDKWAKRPCVERYFAYRNELALKMRDFAFPECNYHVTFYMPMPRSWGKAKRAEHEGRPHRQKPDKDNLEKALLDALLPEDSAVWDGRVSKRWSETPRIEITIEPENQP